MLERSKRSLFAGVAVLMAALMAGCGKTNGDAIEALRPEYAAERTRLASFVAKLPPAGSVTATSFAAFTPSLVWSDVSATRATSNAAFFSLGQLTAPDTRLADRGPDVPFSSELLTCLLWTGPANPMAASALGNREGERLESECRAALAVPYVVVLRPLTFQAPNAVSADTYGPGSLVVEVIVLAHATGAVVASARVEGRSADRVEYVYRQGEDQVEALSRFAYSTLWSSVRSAMSTAFTSGGHRVTPSGS